MKGLAIGRIVHYCPPPSAPHPVQAAIVTQVVDKDKGIVNLLIFPVGNPYPEKNVRYSEAQPLPNSWCWPPREDTHGTTQGK